MEDKGAKGVSGRIKQIKGLELFRSCDEEIDYHIINDFSKACEMAFDEFNYYYEGEDGHSWNDIREKEYNDVHESIYERKDYLSISDMVDEIEMDAVNSIEFTREAREVADEIEADLRMCLEVSAVAKEGHKLFDSMFDVYVKGGWPCGWEGNYPEGRLIAYFPSENK